MPPQFQSAQRTWRGAHFHDLRLREVCRLLEAMHGLREEMRTMMDYYRAKGAGLVETPEQRVMVTTLFDCIPPAYSLESFLPDLK